nr:MAG: replication initiator protein [Microvirus sp.]
MPGHPAMRVHLDRATALGIRALRAGATQDKLHKLAWDVSGDCTEPLIREVTGSSDLEDFGGAVGPGLGRSLFIDLKVRCRGCERCRHARRAMWFHRALAETMSAKRSWFGTLTLRPEEQYRFKCLALGRNPCLEELDERQQLTLINVGIYREIQKYLKRLRKDSGAKFRYLLVCEAHKSGLPHYHILLHEVTDTPVTKRTLDQQWKLGYTKWRLVEEQVKAAGYVCKYLFKSDTPRPYASLHYGECAGRRREPIGIDGAEAEAMTSEKGTS